LFWNDQEPEAAEHREERVHERERQKLILNAVQERPVATIGELVELTGTSEATIRRDISALHVQGRLRRVRGGAEALHPPQFVGIAARPFKVAESVNIDRKRAIARAAVALCNDGDSVIINGGTTTFQMVHYLSQSRLQVLTNSFPIADHLMKHSRNTVMVPGGAIYREQGLILSPFDNDVTRNFFAHRMFMGAQGVGRLGVMEREPLLIQAEKKLLDQAEQLVVLVDSSKFAQRSSLILCGLDRVDTIVTDDGIGEDVATMLQDAGVKLVMAQPAPLRETLQLSESA
jgi:DeoR family transcriptional regulator, ulaG and ulaABCDEF operon transcriptional repressor